MLYLQPEAGLGYIDDEGRVTVLVAGQWAWEDQHQIAHALGLPPEKIRVIYPAIGGAFGGREDESIQIILALAAWKLQRPVKIIWSREESIKYHGKRHQMFFRAKTGAKRDGTLVAASVEAIADAGAYAYTSSKVLFNTTLTCTGPYRIPNVHVDAYAVYTNNVPQAAFRGFGAPQGHFVAESQMNKLAEKLGMDAVELRMKNFLRDGDEISTQAPLTGGPVTLVQVTQACADKFGWNEAGKRIPRRVIGIGKLVQARALALRADSKISAFRLALPNVPGRRWNCKARRDRTSQVFYRRAPNAGRGIILPWHSGCARVESAARKNRTGGERYGVHRTSGSASASRLTTMASRAVRAQRKRRWKNGRMKNVPAHAESLLCPRDPND